MANRLATAPRTAALPLWPDVGEDDPVKIELEALKDERRINGVREACALLLADLRQHELWPEPMLDPDCDRWKIPLTLKDTP